MNETQKTIKYIATAFAILLAFSIIVSIISAVAKVGSIFSPNDNISEKMIDTKINTNINKLDIDIHSANLIIRSGNEFLAKTNNKDIVIKENNNILEIKEKDNNLFTVESGDLIIYLPPSILFQEVEVEVGAGRVEIKDLITEILHLELGAGKVLIEDITATQECEIDGGAGNMNINNTNLNNLDLDMGVGKLALSSIITGNSDIDSGIGSLDVILLGNKEDYKVLLNKGLGETIIDGNNLADNSTYGSGINNIKVNSGIGNININFSK